MDPLASKYAHLTPYNYADNNPINDYDIDGQQDNNTKGSEQPTTNSTNVASTTNKATSNKNITLTAEKAQQTFKDKTNGTYDQKQQGEQIQKMTEQSTANHSNEQILGEKDPSFWMNKNNPEIASYVQTKNLMASQSGAMAFCIWFNGIASPMIANFGVGERTTTEPKIATEFITPQKIANPQNPQTGNGGIGSNLKSNATPVNDGKYANFVELNTNEIHFMQSSIKNTTGDHTVLENAEALKDGSLNPEILRMNVWKDENGKVWSLDNRRLAAFKLSGLNKAPSQWADPAKQMWKMTTTNGGTSIKLKVGIGNTIIIR